MNSPRLSSILSRPFEIAILGAVLVVGLLFILGIVFPGTGLASSKSLSSLTLDVLLAVASSWVLGGGLGLLGQVWPNRVKGLLLERGALYFVASGCSVYAAAVSFVSGVAGLGTLALLVGIVIACVIRIRAIPGEAQTLVTISKALNGEEDKK